MVEILVIRTSMRPTFRSTSSRKAGIFMAATGVITTCRCICSVGSHNFMRGLTARVSTPVRGDFVRIAGQISEHRLPVETEAWGDSDYCHEAQSSWRESSAAHYMLKPPDSSAVYRRTGSLLTRGSSLTAIRVNVLVLPRHSNQRPNLGARRTAASAQRS